MKRKIIISVFTILLLTISNFVSAQDNITIVTPTSEVAEGLDLYAVAELFKDSENLEEFEQALNNPEIGINNLDLDGDGYVDYIRVVEQVTDYTHVIILQVPLGEDEFQDIVTIEIEKTGDEDYNMQVHGNEVIYGVDYYVSPVYVRIHTWPIITWIYRPFYRPYWSVFYFGYYPHWWKPYRPVAVLVYHTRTHRYSRRAGFHVTRVSRVETVHKVNYKPHTSDLVKKKQRVVYPTPEPNRIMKDSRPTEPSRKQTTVNKGMNATREKKGETAIKGEVRKSTKPRIRKSATFNNGINKTAKPKVEKKATVKREVKKNTKPGIENSTTVKSGVNKTAKLRVSPTATVKSGVKKTSKPKLEKKTTIKKDNKKTIVKKENNN
jgi:hypothetical protein